MARKRAQQSSALDGAFELFAITPSWVGPVVAVLIYSIVRYIAPLLFQPKLGQVDVGVIVRQLLPLFAWVCAGSVLLAWLAAEFHKLTNRRLLDRQSGIDSIRALSWREFEHLVCEAYRRKGYLAETVGGAGGDGGVDVELRGHGETILVQCKQWKAYTVGVKTARELLGVVVDRRASGGFLVTSGRFTQDAVAFAKKNVQIELVDGDELAALIESVRENGSGTSGARTLPPHVSRLKTPAASIAPSPQASDGSVPSCPSCGEQMVTRKARKGTHAGSDFWGCPRYPACRGIRNI